MASINEIHYLMTTARAEHPVASSAIAEFIRAYKQAREDSDDGIRESAAFIARALQEHARGWLDDDDMIILLEGQRDLAGLRANNAQIALGSRIRSTVIRLIDIARRCWSARYNQDCGNCLRLSSGSAFTAC